MAPAGSSPTATFFDHLLDIEAFQKAVRRHDREDEMTEEPLHDNRSAGRLIDGEPRR